MIDVRFHEPGEDHPRARVALRRALTLLGAGSTGDNDLALQVFGDVLHDVGGDVEAMAEVVWVLSQLGGWFVQGEDQAMTPREVLAFLHERYGGTE